MSPTVAKTILRASAALAAAVGIGSLASSCYFLFKSIVGRDLLMGIMGVLSLGLSVYLGYVAFLVWFRFSPPAVRHICGFLAFSLLPITTEFLNPLNETDTALSSILSLGVLVAVYFAYRFASVRLIRLLFDNSMP